MSYYRTPAIFGGILALGVILIFFLYLIFGVAHVEADNSNLQGSALSDCIEKYKHLTGAATLDVPNLYSLNGFCFDTLGSQLKLDQEQIRRNTFLFQSNENVVLLYMVVIITFSGVLLAGIQLIGSYKLAVIGRGELAGGGELTYSSSSGAMSFKSSVIGLTILALSFGFFLVFVKDVYPLKDMTTAANAHTSPRQGGFPNNLVPVLSGPQGNKPAQPANLQVPTQTSPRQDGFPNNLIPVLPGPQSNKPAQPANLHVPAETGAHVIHGRNIVRSSLLRSRAERADASVPVTARTCPRPTGSLRGPPLRALAAATQN
jgi:hypothetical protein